MEGMLLILHLLTYLQFLLFIRIENIEIFDKDPLSLAMSEDAEAKSKIQRYA